MNQGFHPQTTPGEQNTGPFGRTKFVSGNTQGVHTKRSNVQRQPSGRLHCVRVEGDAVFPSHCRQGSNGLDRSDLVVRVHDAHHRSFGPYDCPQGVNGDHAVSIDRKHVHGEPVHSLKVAGRLFHCGMLDGADHDPVQRGGCRLPGQRDAFDGEIVRFRASGGEGHLPGTAVQDLRDAGTGLCECSCCRFAEAVMTGRVAELAAEVRPHGFKGLTANRCGGGGVEEDHGGYAFSSVWV
ncbi:hypothetical protein D3C73_1007250 [compost metagenome]